MADFGTYREPTEIFKTGDIFTAAELNNLYSGLILSLQKGDQALETTSTIQNLKDQLIAAMNSSAQQAETSINSAITSAREELNGYVTNINNTLTTSFNNYTQTLEGILGNAYYDENGLVVPSNGNDIDSRITTLYNAIFGAGTSNSKIATLEANYNTLTSSITTILGSDYYNNNTWITTGSTISQRLNTIESAIGTNGSGTSLSGRVTATEEDIDTINEYLGLVSGGAGSTSLIEKIENALGISLNSVDNPAIQIETKTTSLYTMIRQLQGILGVEGGAAGQQSNLVNTISELSEAIYGSGNTELGDGYTLARVLNDLYGELIINEETQVASRSSNPLIDNLRTLPTSMNNLSSQVLAVKEEIEGETGVDTRLRAIENKSNRIDNAYIDAYTFTLEKDGPTWLRLSRDDSARPTTVEEMDADLKNTYIQLPEGGGGGAGTGGGTAIITRITDASVQVLTGNVCNIEYKLEVRDNSGELAGDGTAIWYVGGVQVATSPAINITGTNPNLTNTFNIAQYLSVGSNNITLQVSVNTGGEYDTIVRKTWTVNVINFSLTWNYNEATVFDKGIISLEWTPYGTNISKTTWMKIDNEEPIAISTTMQSGITQIYTFNHNLSHGIHTCELYLSATVNNQNETTAHQSHDLIIVEPGNTTPIISSSFVTDSMEQYDTVSIPIVIYTPNSTITNNIILKVNEEVVDTWNNINRSVQFWNYSAFTPGVQTLSISVGSVIKTIIINVIGISINNREVDGYNLKLKANEFTSNNNLQQFNINNIPLTFSSNFDWVNGGLKTEKNSNGNIQQYICIKSGTSMTIPYKPFNNFDTPLTSSGFNFKIIFKITNCSDYDAEFLNCIVNNIGIGMSAHNAFLSSNTLFTPDKRLSTQYSEDSYIELEFDIYPQNTDDEGNSINYSYIDCWIDGVLSNVKIYDSSTTFNQLGTNENPYKDIVINPQNCDVYLYLIKVYNKRLSFNDHIANFIADAPNAIEMKARYNRNDILGDTNEISYEKLLKQNPNLRVWLYDIPYMTISKNDKIKNCSFQQMRLRNNNEVYAEFTGKGTISVQGTSSVKYIKGAANIDINFTELMDYNRNNLLLNGAKDEDHYGKNWFVADPENNNAVKIYTVQEGEILTSDCVPVVKDSNNQVTHYIKALGYKINENSCPITYSNTKVNFASCEQVNNMCNAIWYQRYNPYPSLTARDCMEFALGVQFIKDENSANNLPDNDHFVLFGDDKYHFYSIANMGNSKKNIHVFHDLSNPNEVCIEVNDNDKNQMNMTSDDLSAENWSGDVYFSMRYPDTKNPSPEIKQAWQRLVTWMATRNPKAATNQSLGTTIHFEPYTFKGHDREGLQVLKNTTVSQYAGDYTTDSFEYRMAKMLSECEDYLVMDSFVYHYLYLERHTMVDNVSKNNFWSSTDLIHWDLSKAYDMDTSDGNNNQGAFEFDYGNEWNDDRTGGGGKVFNGSDSVWFVFIANLLEACATMFINREAEGAWSAINYHKFLTEEQQKIPERVWNICYKYDYLRTYPANDWINFLAGGQKIHQRHHYEYFEELYDSSKYRGTVSTSQNVNFRSYTPTTWEGVEPKGEVTVTMYNKIYISVDAGTTRLATVKAEKGVPVTIDFSGRGNLGNTLIAINTASMIQSIEGLEQLYSDTANFSAAIRLKELSIGSLVPGYKNTQFNTLSLTNNKLLERLYVQNLTNANITLDLSNCPALKYLDARGAGFTGYIFANGGKLEEAYLNSPTSIEMNNLLYLQDNKLHITNMSNLQYLTINNCKYIDSFNRILDLNSLLQLNLLNINWRIPGESFDSFVEKIKTIPNYLITGSIYLTEDMGTFNINKIRGLFTQDLTMYYVNTSGEVLRYYNVIFYGLRNEAIDMQYIFSGGTASDVANQINTEEYTIEYNIWRDSTWQNGDTTRYAFSNWDRENLNNITEDTSIYAVSDIQYKINFIYRTSDPTIFDTQFRYFFDGDPINAPQGVISSFERDYYLYTQASNGWTLEDVTSDTEADMAHTPIPDSRYNKAADLETWYAVYTKTPQTYDVFIWNEKEDGTRIKVNSDAPLRKTIIPRTDYLNSNKIQASELNNYIPSPSNEIAFIDDDINKTDEDRQYKFLGWEPYISTSGVLMKPGLSFTIKYYNDYDIFTKYFLNKLIKCDLPEEITTLPEGAFLQNTNMTHLTTYATNVGAFSFSNGAAGNKYYIFKGTEVTFSRGCFNGINNAVIIFDGLGNFTVAAGSFCYMTNCNIIILNSSTPISSINGIYDSFINFDANGSENKVFITQEAFAKYPESTTAVNDYMIPNNLLTNDRRVINPIETNLGEVNSLLTAAGHEVIEV